MTNTSPKSPVPWWQPGIMLFAQVASWIVFPMIGGIYLGRWLDARYATEQRYFLLCSAIAFVITFTGLILQTKQALKAMQDKDISDKQQ